MSDLAQLLVEHLDIWTGAIERKNGAGRGNGGTVALYGIEKLRSLILSLAIHGKLVRQDPSDEPASELLRRVYQERKKLVSQGALSKPKELHSNSSSLQSVCRPGGWATELFGNIFSLEYGDNLPESKRTQSGEVPVYGSNGVVGTHSDASVHKPCIVVGRKGSAGAVNRCDQPHCWVTDVAYYCIPPTGFDLRFVEILFRTLELDELGKGIKPGLNRNEAYALPVAVPCLVEQQRIVAKVDELMALCDALEAGTYEEMATHEKLVRELLATLVNSKDADDLAINWSRIEVHFDRLFTTEESIGALEQSILSLGVRGLLVRQSKSDEPAKRLLEKIYKEKAELVALRGLKNETGFSENGNPSWLPTLPEGWCSARPPDFLLKITDGEHFRPPTQSEGVYFLSAKDIREEGVNLDDPLFVSAETAARARARCDPDFGDLLIVSRGATCGRICRVDIRETFCLLGSVILLKLSSYIDGGYLEIALRSPEVFNSLITASGATAQGAIYLRDLKKIVFPVPPIEEQKRIVSRVTELRALTKRLRAKMAQTAELRQRLADGYQNELVT